MTGRLSQGGVLEMFGGSGFGLFPLVDGVNVIVAREVFFT